ncbi:amidase [Paraburkholderia sediminicola]|uniref:amidase n=1 Tax=Paraburkholderia sediminicola TaxID=458836 RepID=UPI0038B6EEDA
MESEIVDFGAIELAKLIKRRDISCRDVMSAYLNRIDRWNPVVNAIVSMPDQEELLDQADEKDRLLGAGQYLGPLHGLPQAPKDASAVAGMLSTYGSPIFADHVPIEDSIFISRMRAAGSIFVGRTNTPEFGLGGQTYNTVFGTTRNAYDPAMTSGGSSGGAAVALAARMLPVADGGDMMGSLRTPAAFNNVFGLRPSRGVVPFGPTPELFLQQLVCEGPMARNVPDLALLLQIMAGHDHRAPLSLDRDPTTYAGSLDRDFGGTRIGWVRDWSGYFPMEQGVLDLCDQAVRMFETLGCNVETLDDEMLGFPPERLWSAWVTLRNFLMAGSLGGHYENPVTRAQLKPEAIWEIERGLALSGSDIYKASLDRSAWYSRLLTIFARYDYLIFPGAQVFPFSAEIHWPSEINGRAMDTYHRWIEVAIPASMAGLPSMSTPAGFSDTGLPMGIQIVGPCGSDFSVMQLAHQYDLATGLSRNKPYR